MFLERKFSISSSFGSQLSQECVRAGSEPYVRTHITEPPCWYCNENYEINKFNIFSTH